MKLGSKKSILLLVAASLSLVAVFAIFDSFGPDSFVFRKEVRRGNAIISKIDAFHRQRRRLPTSMDEIGISAPDANRFFYEKCSDRRFLVWFGTRLGESMTYDSDALKWQSLNIACAETR